MPDRECACACLIQDCVCLIPLCPAWACHCAPVVFHREGQTNKFKSYGEGMWLQFRSRSDMTSNACGSVTKDCGGYPKSVKVCPLPVCVGSVCAVCCCMCQKPPKR